MPSSLSQRKRTIKGPRFHGRLSKRSEPGGPYNVTYFDSKIDGIQITESEGHAFHGKYHGEDEGGDFLTLRSEGRASTVSTHLESKGEFSHGIYDGTLSPAIPYDLSKPVFSMPASLSFASDLDAKGAAAVAACNPLNPVASAATFLTEAFHERLPSLPGIRLWEGRTKALLGAADEFLNAEFGWLPMIREVREIAGAVRLAGQVMAQYQRDAGRLVRRSFYFPIEDNTTSKIIATESVPMFGGTTQFPGHGMGGPGVMSTGRVSETKQTRRKVWFKGAFTYPVPDQSDAWSRLMSAASGSNAGNKAFGTSLTPETLWELAPWSWAIDWFSNAQEVVSNLQAFELAGLVMPYGYIMDETINKVTYTWEEDAPVLGHIPPLAVTPIVLETIKKTRKQANPFGFGIELSDLSATQLAILAALGITLAL
jgi:hypothetical protein